MTHTDQLEKRLESATDDARRLELLTDLVGVCASDAAKPAQTSAKGLRYGEMAVDLALRMDGDPVARARLRDALIGMGRIQRRDGAREAAVALAEAQARYEVEKREKEAEIYRLKNVELAEANRKLQRALDEVQLLSGLLPICGSCKRIRDEEGSWTRLESYIQARSSARFSHGICPDCAKEYR